MSQTPEVGVYLTVFGERATPENFCRVAAAAERSGLDAVWAGDHVAFPEDISGYPFSPTGEFPFDKTDAIYDVFQVLSHLAATTESINLGTNTCIAPYRHPLVTIRNVLTAEQLTDERFDFGVAAGWMQSEFEALDVPYEERGGRTDELLEILTRTRTEEEFAFDGEYYSFQQTGFHPTLADERPSIWIGGSSGASFRRIGQYGDGWAAIWEHPDDIEAKRARIMNAWQDYGRDGEPEIALLRPVHIGTDRGHDTDRLLVGSTDSVIADIESYLNAGMTRLIMGTFLSDSVDDQIEQIDRVANEVLPSF
jgi:probable F420-dependent oxidoreductase